MGFFRGGRRVQGDVNANFIGVQLGGGRRSWRWFLPHFVAFFFGLRPLGRRVPLFSVAGSSVIARDILECTSKTPTPTPTLRSHFDSSRGYLWISVACGTVRCHLVQAYLIQFLYARCLCLDSGCLSTRFPSRNSTRPSPSILAMLESFAHVRALAALPAAASRRRRSVFLISAVVFAVAATWWA